METIHHYKETHAEIHTGCNCPVKVDVISVSLCVSNCLSVSFSLCVSVSLSLSPSHADRLEGMKYAAHVSESISQH